LKLCYGLNIGTPAYHIKKKIPCFKIFSSFELWKNNPVSTRRYRFGNASSLLESVLVFELCIHRRHQRVNLRHVCSSFFSRPVQTSHHPLNRQQDNVHPLCVSWKQSYQLFSFCWLLSQNCPSRPRMLSLSGIWFWLGFSTIQCGLFLLLWCCSCTFHISDTPFLVTT